MWTYFLIYAFGLLSAHLVNSIDVSGPDRFFLKARNQYLRLYILHKKTKFKYCILAAKDAIEDKLKEKTNRVYQSLLSRYYDANIAYYSLPEEDRAIIEQIINLHF